MYLKESKLRCVYFSSKYLAEYDLLSTFSSKLGRVSGGFGGNNNWWVSGGFGDCWVSGGLGVGWRVSGGLGVDWHVSDGGLASLSFSLKHRVIDRVDRKYVGRL